MSKFSSESEMLPLTGLINVCNMKSIGILNLFLMNSNSICIHQKTDLNGHMKSNHRKKVVDGGLESEKGGKCCNVSKREKTTKIICKDN